jgi:hypothetical protein
VDALARTLQHLRNASGISVMVAYAVACVHLIMVQHAGGTIRTAAACFNSKILFK